MRKGFNPRRFNLGAFNKGRAVPFDKKYIPEPNSGCWLWTGALNKHGYGWLKRDGQQIAAHRMSWALSYGDPGNQMVLHRCDVACCVNPDHLFLGDAVSNVMDKMAKGRHRVLRGEKHKAAKLTEKDVLAIREDRRPQTHIAKHYKVSSALISLIKSRLLWRHLA